MENIFRRSVTPPAISSAMADVSGQLQVRNTFLETVDKDFDDDFLDMDMGFDRAVTAPALFSIDEHSDQPAYVKKDEISSTVNAAPGEWSLADALFTQPAPDMHSGIDNGLIAGISGREDIRKSRFASQTARQGSWPPTGAGNMTMSGGRAPKQSMDFAWAARAAADLDAGISQQVTLASIRNLPWSVTLADPNLQDCPLIACSHNFETITGYSWHEVVGRNCRFLNRGMEIDPTLRKRMHESVQNGSEFVGILQNVRKNGEQFRNLLHLSTMAVNSKAYIIGLQADVTHVEVNPYEPGHINAMKAAAEAVFNSNIDAWVQMHAREFSIRLSAPYSRLLKICAPDDFQRERDSSVKLGASLASLKIPKQGVDLANKLGPNGYAIKDELRNVSKQDKTSSSDGEKHETGKKSLTAGSKEQKAVKSRLPVQGQVSGQTAPSSASQPLAVAGAVVTVKSAGSSLHPDNCTECHFFNFGPNGCRAGKDCIFCHELHPRRNAKKNRRFIKRLVDSGVLNNPGGSGADKSEPSLEDAIAENILWSRQTTEDSVTSMGSETSSPQKGLGSSLMTLKYREDEPSDRPPRPLIMVAGIKANFPAFLKTASDRQALLEQVIRFSVEPTLPEGLVLDDSSGSICGIPLQAQDSPSVHQITISIEATGKNGIPLGALPLTACCIAIRIFDLQQFTLTSAEEVTDGEDIVMKFRPA